MELAETEMGMAAQRDWPTDRLGKLDFEAESGLRVAVPTLASELKPAQLFSAQAVDEQRIDPRGSRQAVIGRFACYFLREPVTE